MKDHTDDLQSVLAGLSSNYRAQEETLRAALSALSTRLAEICTECSTQYSGRTVEIAWCGPDERIYGHWYCGEGGLRVACRSTSDDLAMTEPGVFTLHPLDKCPVEWLRELTREENVIQFGEGLAKHLRRLVTETKSRAKLVQSMAESPTASISEDFERAAEAIGYDRAVVDWKEAHAAIYTSPERAITAACTMLETVCKHVLDDCGQEYPKKQSIAPLFSAAAKTVGLDPSAQAEPELRGFCGGLASVVQNLGALRTKFGDAHGKDGAYTGLSSAHARLVVNAAGSAATFLMERYTLTRKPTT